MPAGTTVPASPPRIRWTRGQCRSLIAADILRAATFELIDGEIRLKVGQNEPHVRGVVRLMLALVHCFGEDFVRSQAPIALGPNDEPEPDGAVTVQPASVYLESDTPDAAEIRLVAEVSASTLLYDQNEKGPLYAAAGIPEYWIVDVAARRLLVHRDPTADGYASMQTYLPGDSVAPLAAPTHPVPVDDLLP